MRNNYIKEIHTVENDTWEIHYLHLDDLTVKIVCDLMRSNRKFWQSKILWSDWTYCSSKNANLLKSMAYDVIANYYDIQRSKKKIDDFFENAIDK